MIIQENKHNGMKILILMSYFNRPILVRRSLESILKANEFYQNWCLAFGDDGSIVPGRPIVEEILRDHLNKVTFRSTGMTVEEKSRTGLTLGHYANDAIINSDADIGIMLCDDDELVPDYLARLAEFFEHNDSVKYCYSKVSLFNPLTKNSSRSMNCTGRINGWSGPIEPVGRVDASQVAWRLSCCKEDGAWFAESTLSESGNAWSKDTDRSFFSNLYEKCGPCFPSGIVAQFKGIHDYQLLWNKKGDERSLVIYGKMCEELAGVEF